MSYNNLNAVEILILDQCPEELRNELYNMSRIDKVLFTFTSMKCKYHSELDLLKIKLTNILIYCVIYIHVVGI